MSLFRIYYFEIFLKVHHFLAIVSIGALLWHVIIAEGMELKMLILPLVSILLWVVSFIPFLSHLRIRSREVVISKFYRVRTIGRHDYREVDVMQIDITLRHPVGIKPGQWAYLRVQDFYLSNKVQTHPFMISWWTPAHDINQRKKDGVSEAQSLTMLVRPVNGLTRRLSSKTFLEGVSFDGPLGQDLQLEKYHNVFLAVKGIGIAGVLSYAKHLVELESTLPDKRRITPRKLDLYWELEDNSQEEWAGPFLRQLQLKNDAVFIHLFV
jgi:predicted ferric reductase